MKPQGPALPSYSFHPFVGLLAHRAAQPSVFTKKSQI